MEIFDVKMDLVIRSAVVSGRTNYRDGLERFYPLIDRFEEQRKLQRPKFYQRLRGDIIKGCIMPPITLAFVSNSPEEIQDNGKAQDFINRNIEDGYILDGMQRLNTLHSASEEAEFDWGRPIYFNVIVASKYDLLLYRMITLNNGQKPMTVRHQVEMLTGNLIKKLLADQSLINISILSEKETENSSPRGSFRLIDIAAAYLSFLTNSAHNQNARFIEEKLDEILVGKVMSSGAISEENSFQEILQCVDRLSANMQAKEWFRNENNLIGFTLGAKKNMDTLNEIDPGSFADEIAMFERAFQAINPSKVNVGKFRRDLSLFFVENVGSGETEESLTEKFFEVTAS